MKHFSITNGHGVISFTLPADEFILEQQMRKALPAMSILTFETDKEIYRKQNISSLKRNVGTQHYNSCITTCLHNLLIDKRATPQFVWLDYCSKLHPKLMQSIGEIFAGIKPGANGAVYALTLFGGRESKETIENLLDVCDVKKNTKESRVLCRQKLYPEFLANLIRNNGFDVSVSVYKYIPENRKDGRGCPMYTYIFDIINRDL